VAGQSAVRRAVGGVADALDAAVAHGRDDLEMAGADTDLRAPLAPVMVETLGRLGGARPS
jgi:hypothetical protein